MDTQTTTTWRNDVVASGHGDHGPIPPGAERGATAAAWRAALESDGPAALILSRQGLPALPTDQIHVGGVVIADGDQATILATGSEVHVALDARDLLANRGVSARVVSLPSTAS